MDDKVRTKIAEICIKTKWRPIKSQIFKLNQFQLNMSQIVPYDSTFKKSLQACSSEIACLGVKGSKCFKIVYFSHWRRDLQISFFPRVKVKYFESQILQIWYQHEAFTRLSTYNITKSHQGIIMCAELQFIPITVCRTHQCVYRGQRGKPAYILY